MSANRSEKTQQKIDIVKEEAEKEAKKPDRSEPQDQHQRTVERIRNEVGQK